MSTIRNSQYVFVLSLLAIHIGMLLSNYSTNIDRLVAISITDHQASAASNSIDQIIKQRNITSNQSSDLTSEEVQLLRDLGQGFSRTTTQSQFGSFTHFPSGYSIDYLWIETYHQGART